jgi:hypothetical protein
MVEEFAMTSDQIAIEHCAALYGLDSNEFMKDVTPNAMHASLHASYLLLHKTGWTTVRDLIIADICAALDLGASKKAADLLLVLRMLLFEHPEFAIAQQCRTSLRKASAPRRLRRHRRSRGNVVQRERIGLIRAARVSSFRGCRPTGPDGSPVRATGWSGRSHRIRRQ